MVVRAKMKCNSITKTGDAKKPTVQVQLGAVYSQDPGSENKSFASYTPSASVSLNIDAGRPAASAFELGMEYYVDFIPVGIPERCYLKDNQPTQGTSVVLESRDKSKSLRAYYDPGKYRGYIVEGDSKGPRSFYDDKVLEEFGVEFWRYPNDDEEAFVPVEKVTA